MYADPTGHFVLWVFLVNVAISALFAAIDGGITAAMLGQDFWKGFAAGAIGGAIGGALSAIPGVGNLVGRAASTIVYNLMNEVFQKGKLNVDNFGLYIIDTMLDVVTSMLYVNKASK